MTQQNYAELKSHIDQLWKIIEQQDSQIQELKKANNTLCNERDELQERKVAMETPTVAIQDKSTIRDQETVESTNTTEGAPIDNNNSNSNSDSNPILPARSPHRAYSSNDFDANTLKERKQPVSSTTSLSLSPVVTKAPTITSPVSTTSINDSTIMDDTNSSNNNTSTTNNVPSQEAISPKIIEQDAKLFAQYQSAVSKRGMINGMPETTRQYPPSPIVLVPSKSSTLPSQSHEARLAQRKQHSSMVFPSTIVIPMASRKKNDDQHIRKNSTHITPSTMKPSNIADITVRVIGSILKSNEKGRDVISFLLSVGKQTKDGFKELWRVQKLYSDFLDLDQKLKSQMVGSKTNKMTRLPDKQLFSTRSPNKLDQRRAALEKYLHHVITLPMDNISELCEFLSTNVEDHSNGGINQGNKEGYLTKRGKNFGGWKTRYFSLKKKRLDYYETKDGSKLGSISLDGAQIGRQTPPNTGAAEEGNDSAYRHAILILEYRRTSIGNYVRHILCANSETDCDEWIAALLQALQSNNESSNSGDTTTLSITRSNSTSNKDRPRISKKTSPSDKQRKLFKGEIRTVSATPISHLRMNSSHQFVDMEKLTSVPLSETHSPTAPLTINSPPSDSSDNYNGMLTSPGTAPSDSLPLSSPLSTSSLDLPSTPLQPNHSNIFGTSPEKGNPLGGMYYQQQQPSLSKTNSLEERAISPQPRANSPIPAALLDRRESDDSVTNGGDQQQDKKSKSKSANRMTLWGKKVFGNQQRSLSSPTSPNNPMATMLSALESSSLTVATSPSSSFGNPTPPSSSSSSSSSTQQQQQQQQQPIQPQPIHQEHRSTQKSLRHILSRPTQQQPEGGSDDNDNNKYVNKPFMPSLSKSSPGSSSGSKQVFGVPLEEAVRVSGVSDGYPLPAIVFRCIEYLDAKNAVLEEGLYRLSGSNALLQKLKKKFNQDGDVPLLQSKEDYDVHVIAGLLKMWLRELPVTVLTRELRPEFIQVIDLLERKDRVNELGRLVSELPLANYTLLRILTSHLIRVIKHSDVNLMTVRNIAIVFSPTLGIPGTIFNLFLNEFDYIFWTNKDGDAAPRRLEEPDDDDDEEDDDTDHTTIEASGSTTLGSEDHTNNQEQKDATAKGETTKPTDNYQQLALGHGPTGELHAPISSVVVPRRDFKKHLSIRENHGRSNRNSVLYLNAAPNAIVDLEKHTTGGTKMTEDDEDVDDLTMDVDEDNDTQN
ncbi:hypothetical protein BC941DRAFT_437376 [Chlamydoabsidia padenii]|nr:hypothetical protein BC941DRAFT_437376 [Chlamydoabsidia padenii]